jgi:6-phosphofructokinase 1
MPVQINFNTSSKNFIEWLGKVRPFQKLGKNELQAVSKLLKKYEFEANEIVIREGETGSTAFIIAEGQFDLEIMGRVVKTFSPADFFGEIALIDARPRMGTVRAVTRGSVLVMDGQDLEKEELVSSKTAMKLYQAFARMVTSYMRESTDIYNEIDVLLIQDGGCAPGYNPITAFLTEHLEKAGRNVYIAAEGFKSLVLNRTQDYRRLIHDPAIYQDLEQIPGVVFAPPLREARGADFRTERFPEFKEEKNQQIAIGNIIARRIKIIIGIGGNGTFAGTNAISKLLPDTIQTFFIPVTIDSDIYGTDCIGEFTGVEVGAEKIRSYMADARTHKRFYIIEMMGAHGGYHALHSCLGAGAHLAVLPSSHHELSKIITSLQHRDSVVIVVAEGYKQKERRDLHYKGNAAEFFRDELLTAGLKTDHRIVCEGFSRDIRGAAPNNLDIMLAQRMARKLTSLVQTGQSRKMPAVLSGRESSIDFDDIRTDNSVESGLASLANRLTLNL